MHIANSILPPPAPRPPPPPLIPSFSPLPLSEKFIFATRVRKQVTFTEFRRGMDACGCFANVTENEFSTMQQLFKEATPARPCSARGPYAHTVMRMCYALFCEVVQPSGEATAPMTDALAELVGRMPPVDVKSSRGR